MVMTLSCGDKQKTKHLTISSSPTEKFLDITKRLTGHELSTALKTIKVGDKAIIRGPYGDSTFHGEHEKGLHVIRWHRYNSSVQYDSLFNG